MEVVQRAKAFQDVVNKLKNCYRCGNSHIKPEDCREINRSEVFKCVGCGTYGHSLATGFECGTCKRIMEYWKCSQCGYAAVGGNCTKCKLPATLWKCLACGVESVGRLCVGCFIPKDELTLCPTCGESTMLSKDGPTACCKCEFVKQSQETHSVRASFAKDDLWTCESCLIEVRGSKCNICEALSPQKNFCPSCGALVMKPGVECVSCLSPAHWICTSCKETTNGLHFCTHCKAPVDLWFCTHCGEEGKGFNCASCSKVMKAWNCTKCGNPFARGANCYVCLSSIPRWICSRCFLPGMGEECGACGRQVDRWWCTYCGNKKALGRSCTSCLRSINHWKCPECGNHAAGLKCFKCDHFVKAKLCDNCGTTVYGPKFCSFCIEKKLPVPKCCNYCKRSIESVRKKPISKIY